MNRRGRSARISSITSLLIGILVGLNIAIVSIVDQSSQTAYNSHPRRIQYWYSGGLLETEANGNSVPNVPMHFHASIAHGGDDTSVAEAVATKVRVLCLIFTLEQYHWSHAKPVKATWGKRCTKYIFLSSIDDPDLPSIKLNITEGYSYLWQKTKAAFQYAHDNYIDQFDWFLKTDDDTYVILENLRFLLLAHNPEEPIYLGFKIRDESQRPYMSGGAGYVLSRMAVKKLVTEGLTDPVKCSPENKGVEDQEMGKCLENLNITAIDARDSEGKLRFLPLSLSKMIGLDQSEESYWINTSSYYPVKQGSECCSDYGISVHYVDTEKIYALEYLIYHLHTFGISEVYGRRGDTLDIAYRIAMQNRGPSFDDLVSAPDDINTRSDSRPVIGGPADNNSTQPK